MGCVESKPIPPSDVAKTKSSGEGTQRLFREPSVVIRDQSVAMEIPKKAATKQAKNITSKGKNIAHHVANIFATPFDFLDFGENYSTPVFQKAKEDDELIKKALKTNFVFENLSKKEIHPLILAFEPTSVESGKEIITQGDKGNYFYILKKGSVTFKVDGKEVGVAPAGSCFGELALLCKFYLDLMPGVEIQIVPYTFRPYFLMRRQLPTCCDGCRKGELRSIPG
jgi:hypothetical protein